MTKYKANNPKMPAGQYAQAIYHFSHAICVDDSGHVTSKQTKGGITNHFRLR